MNNETVAEMLRAISQELPRVAVSGAPSGELVGSWEEFDLFMGVSEYELAWDTLCELAEGHSPSREFWEGMSKIAKRMNLSDHAARATAHAEKVPMG